MAKPQPTYDLMLLLDLESTDEQRAKVLADSERIITDGGSLIGTHEWGVRELAYEINHQDSADYRLFQFHVNDVATLAELDRTLSIADGLLRHRIIKLAPGTPEPPEPGAPASIETDFDTADER
jgi:small subunit ribosomal protein S6